MTNPIAPARRPAMLRLLPRAALPARALARRLSAVAGWARLSNGTLRLGAAGLAPPLGAKGGALLWQALSELISTIAMLAPEDLPPAAGLAALAELGDRLRERASISAPRPLRPDAEDAPQLFLLEILVHDLQPCLARWQPRLAAWRDAGRRVGVWPLAALCRSDLARTRERLVERGWQLGIALHVAELGRLLPPRPASVPTLTAGDELASAEAAAVLPPDTASLEVGWRIYVEAAARLPAPDFPATPGTLGEAIASLDALANEIRAALKTVPAAAPDGADTIQAEALWLLTEGLLPFLTEWRPRYLRFTASERAEPKWRRADECRAALIATRERSSPMVEAIGRKIGAPPLTRPRAAVAATQGAPPRQLPPPPPPE